MVVVSQALSCTVVDGTLGKFGGREACLTGWPSAQSQNRD